MAEQRKKRSVFPVFMIIIILIVILGLAFKFGLFDKLGILPGGGTNQEEQETASENQPVDQSQESGVKEITLEVHGEEILYDGKSVGLDELDHELSGLDDNSKILLIDHAAIQNTYQEVLNLLNEKEIVFEQSSK